MAVYFLLCKTTQRVKIGTAEHPLSRCAELQIGSPTKLALIGKIPGHRSQEVYLHKLLRKFRLHGEWFQYNDYVRDFIREAVTFGLDDLAADFNEDGFSLNPAPLALSHVR